MNNPLVSIVMPAYNCEKYIRRAIESIINQTYENWELIITEDCSKDHTYDILQQYKNDRIHVFRTEHNSGTVYTPRLNSFNHSKGDYVINIDSDDYIESDYIEKCISKIEQTNAESCCGKMVMIDEEGLLIKKIPTIPDDSFDFDQVLDGRDAFMLTVPRYRIAMNGFASKRVIWQRAWDAYEKPGYRGIHEDENIGKLMLMYSRKVCFADAVHYYTINSSSVTHVFNEKIFDWIVANEDMIRLVKLQYGEGKELHETELANYHAYVHATELLANSIESVDERKLHRYFSGMKKWHDKINWNAVKKYDGIAKWLIGRSFALRWVWKLKRHRAMKYLIYVMRAKEKL